MKKIFAILLCLLTFNITFPLSVFAIEENSSEITVEHIKLPKKLAKKTPTNAVNISSENINILSYNTLELIFAQDFYGKTAQVGDEVVFILKDRLLTNEGTEILPESTKFITEISNIEKPRSFNRSGKIYLNFKSLIIPDGTEIPIQAKLFKNKDYLSRGKMNALGKGFGLTFGGSAIGVAAGCGIGIAASAVIIGGFAIGLPVGFALGAAAGLLTPGLNYKAKAGDKINIQLVNNVVIQK